MGFEVDGGGAAARGPAVMLMTCSIVPSGNDGKECPLKKSRNIDLSDMKEGCVSKRSEWKTISGRTPMLALTDWMSANGASVPLNHKDSWSRAESA